MMRNMYTVIAVNRSSENYSVVDTIVDCCEHKYSKDAPLEGNSSWVFDTGKYSRHTSWMIAVRVCPWCIENPMLLLTHENQYVRLVGREIQSNTHS